LEAENPEIKDTLPWAAKDILAATGGDLLCGDLERRFAKVCIDSREVSIRDLFVAIIGDVHDGHSFLNDVTAQGIQGLVVARDKANALPVANWEKSNHVCVVVDDTTRALGDLAAFHRNRMPAAVVAITGSNGKTTTRKLTAGVAGRKFNTLTAIGNYNNQIGMPLTLLNLQSAHQWAVLELGTNQPGEIARLAEICKPDIGVITNIGPAHLEGLGTLDGVMHEKGSLLAHLKTDGSAVLNADDVRVLKISQNTDRNALLFGLSPEAQIRARSEKEKASGVGFVLDLPGESIAVDLPLHGLFMVSNALAAAAVGYLMGLTLAEIKAGLEKSDAAPGRMNIFSTPDGIHIIDDTYNANPDSMRAAFATLTSLRANSRGIAVLGDMLELGEQAKFLHQKIGALAAASGIARIYATGNYAQAITAGACKTRMKPQETFAGTRDEILKDLKDQLKSGDWILIKGSRGMAMEKIITGLKMWAGIESDDSSSIDI
jgi:UDP-N-acetylmuramoyl-tripeptide--D-alanyl-D-alanine ligase